MYVPKLLRISKDISSDIVLQRQFALPTPIAMKIMTMLANVALISINLITLTFG